jgi:signal transduction histidine kinase
LRRENGTWRRFTKRDGLADERVVSLYEDRAGTLWIGGLMGGLAQFANAKFSAFPLASGGLPRMVSGIAEDDFGNLWLASLDGIHRVSKAELENGDGTANPFVVHYNRADGMRSSECASGTQPTIWKARDGRLWFATVDGVSVTDPRALPSNTNGPSVAIEEVLVDGKKVEMNPLRVPPGAGRVELHFTALTLTSPEKARFKIQMEGSDRNWVDIGTRRVAYYTRLAPGNHTFRVIAANSDGVWNRTGATMALTAFPQYWQTIWFKILVAAGWAGLVLLWYERRLRRMRVRRAEHQAFSQRLLEVQESERKRIAAELHDSLGQTFLVVKNRAILGSQKLENPSAMAADFEQISKSASDGLQEVRQIAYSLRPFELDRLGLKRAIETMLERVAESGEVKIDVQIDELNGIVPPGKEIHLYRVCQEAITNVLKHAHARTVLFELRKNGRVAELEIMDDGKGFDVDALLRDPARGLGLRSMSERVAALHGKFKIESAPGRGSRISVIIGDTNAGSATKN